MTSTQDVGAIPEGGISYPAGGLGDIFGGTPIATPPIAPTDVGAIDTGPSTLSQIGTFVGTLSQAALTGFRIAEGGGSPQLQATPGAAARPSTTPAAGTGLFSGGTVTLLLVGGLLYFAFVK